MQKRFRRSSRSAGSKATRAPAPTNKPVRRSAAAARASSAKASSIARPSASRGRPPKKVFINVLVRETTRANLARLKIAADLDSQGEVIDKLVAEMMLRRPLRGG